MVSPTAVSGTALPEKGSFFTFSAGNVLIGTIKKAEDDNSVILRCYDIEGKPAEVRLGGSLSWVGGRNDEHS